MSPDPRRIIRPLPTLQVEKIMRDTTISNFKRHQLIIPDNRLRKANTAKVEQIAESIKNIGLQNFIFVVARHGVKFELVTGLHRVMAMDSLNINDYTAVCYDADTPVQTLRLIEVDENLARNELSALERAKFVAELKELWDALHGELRGGDKKSRELENQTGQDVPFDFSVNIAELLGVSSRSVRRDQTVSKNLAPHWDKLEDLPFAPTQADLLKLAKLPQDKISDVLRFVRDAFEYPADNDPRMQSLSFEIKAVIAPDKIKPTIEEVSFTQKRINTLDNIFNDISNDALMDWATANLDRLENLLAQAQSYNKVLQDTKDQQ